MSRPRFRFSLGQAQITRGALYLLFVSTGLSLVWLISSPEIRSEMLHWLGATPSSVWREYHLWQLVTAPLLEVQFVSVILNGFMLWVFLPTLEKWWGTKRFLIFAAATSVVGTAVGTLVGLLVGSEMEPVLGLSPFVFAGIVAYGILFANQPVRFFGVLPMTGKQLTIGICGFTLVFILIGQRWSAGAAMAAGIVVAVLMTHDKASPRLLWLKWKQRRIRKHLKVVRDDEPKRWIN